MAFGKQGKSAKAYTSKPMVGKLQKGGKPGTGGVVIAKAPKTVGGNKKTY